MEKDTPVLPDQDAPPAETRALAFALVWAAALLGVSCVGCVWITWFR